MQQRGPFAEEDKALAADFGKDLNALVGEGGIWGSLAEHLGYRLSVTVHVVPASYRGAGFTEEKGAAGIYSYHPWASWPLHGGNERLRSHQGNVFSRGWVCGYEQFQL